MINMSFEFSPAVDSCTKIKSVCEAIKFANKRGAVVVAAAGNSNGEPVAFPAGAPNVIGVGRTTKDACLADESRTGAGLDLVAPGGGLPLLADLRRRRPAVQPRRADLPAHLRRPRLQALRLPGRLRGDLDGRGPRLGRGGDGRSPAGCWARTPRPPRSSASSRRPPATAPASWASPMTRRLFGAGLIDAAAAVAARAPGC